MTSIAPIARVAHQAMRYGQSGDPAADDDYVEHAIPSRLVSASTPNLQLPTPKAARSLGIGSWELGIDTVLYTVLEKTGVALPVPRPQMPVEHHRDIPDEQPAERRHRNRRIVDRDEAIGDGALTRARASSCAEVGRELDSEARFDVAPITRKLHIRLVMTNRRT